MDCLYGWSIDAGWHQLKYGFGWINKACTALVQVTASFILQMTSSGRPGAPLCCVRVSTHKSTSVPFSLSVNALLVP